MKKSLYVAVAATFMLALVVTPKHAGAQKYQGQVVIGANGAFSLFGLAVTTTFNAIDKVQGLKASVVPGLSGTVDYGVTDRFSIGIAHFYQSGTAKWSSYSDDSGNVVTGDFHYRITRQNTAIRALFHFGDNDDLDPYFGIRLGYSYWSTETNVAALSSLKIEDLIKPHFWPQAIFGIRYFFTPYIGVNTEIALGPPYYLTAGLNVRFGGQ